MSETVIGTSLGHILLELAPDGLVRVAQTERPTTEISPSSKAVIEQIRACIDGEIDGQGIPIVAQGSEFHQKVWEALRHIPRGEVRSYSELAAMAGNPRATRAVASACSNNPYVVIVPCHRVVRRDRGLGGFSWGLDLKRQLLEREGIQVSADGYIR
jgi:O-6-methylguanine DNA methyltransferase